MNNDVHSKARALNARWLSLCNRFLPVVEKDSIWRYSRFAERGDAEQGWKLHVSATVLSAGDVFEKIGRLLAARRLMFKAPVSLFELNKINSGLFYGYPQIGKFITVYPRDAEEAVRLARQIHRLTGEFAAPPVPFDQPFRPGSNVFYRYGAFRYLETEDASGRRLPAIKDAAGNLIFDSRAEAIPAWLADPFQTRRANQRQNKAAASPLQTTYRVFRALRQRGRGGVYQAIDLETDAPRLCVVKEGRRNGEVDWDGRDGFFQVRREAEILSALQYANINAPCFYNEFTADSNYYLVTEFIEGKSLEEILKRRRRRIPIKKILDYAAQTADLIASLHDAGWTWGDCKPANLLVAPSGVLRPIDFETACRVGQPKTHSRRTMEFSPPAAMTGDDSAVAEDLYALGAVIYYLLTGAIYQPETPLPLKKLRRGVPMRLREIVERLLRLPLEKNRPAARETGRALKNL